MLLQTSIGCDLEQIEPHTQSFVEDYFTPEEQQLITTTTPSVRPLAIALLWSAKESALKAMHVGLRADTRSVVVKVPPIPCEPWDVWRLVAVRHASGEYGGWWLASGSFVRTVVVALKEQDHVAGESQLAVPCPVIVGRSVVGVFPT